MPAPTIKQVARKDVFTSADLTGGTKGGYLPAEVLDHFLQEWQDTPTLIGDIGLEDVTAPISELNFAGFSDKIFHKATAATALTSDQEGDLGTRKVEFVVRKLKATIPVDDDVMEDNIARGNFDTFLVGEIKNQGALDLEWYCLNADSTSLDEDTNIFDGFLAQVPAGNIIEPATSPDIGKAIFRQGLAALASKYKGDRANMRFYTSHAVWEGYTDSIGARETTLGDQSIIAEPGKVKYKGIPIWPLAHMADDEYLLTPKKNMRVRVLRQIKIVTERSEREEVTYWVVTVRLCPKFLDPNGAILYKNIGTGIDESD